MTAGLIGSCPEQNKQHPGHCISSNLSNQKLIPGQKIDYNFQIQDGNGKPLKNFDISHEKIMHVFVVKKDRSTFWHLHPEYDQNAGTFRLADFVIPEAGSYRLFADFVDGNIKDNLSKNITIYEDFQIGDKVTNPETVSTKEISKKFGNYDVIMLSQPEIVALANTTKLSFLINDVRKNGAPVNALKPYLGAFGHAVIIDRNLNLTHTHSSTGSNESQRGIVEFDFTPDNAGNMAVFAQFQIGDELLTANFGLLVNQSLSEQDQKINSGLHDGH